MIDARLLIPALGAWGGAIAALVVLDRAPTLVIRHALALRLIVVLVVIAGVLGLAVTAAHRRARRHPSDGSASAAWIAAALGAGFLLGGAGAACVSTAVLTPLPAVGWVDARATAAVQAVVAGEPQRRSASAAAPWQESGWLEVRAITARISARGGAVDVSVPLVLRFRQGAEVPPPGSLIAVTGRLSPLPVARAALATVSVSTDGPRVLAPPGALDATAHAMRAGLVTALEGTPSEASALVAGLAVGEESTQPASLTDDMRASGLAHLTAVSGGNVAVVLGAVLLLAAALRLPLWARATTAVGALAFFVLLVGPQPSVLRAAVMGAVVLVALVWGGRRSGPSVLAVAVIALVLTTPTLAVAWGFALSVLATGGLVLLAPRLRHRLETSTWTSRWPPALLEAVSLTVAAQLATLPILVAMGTAVGWVSVPANLAAMPAVPPVTVLGLLAAVTAPVLPVASGLLAHLAAWPAAWIALVARVAPTLPMASVGSPGGWRGVGLLIALSGAAVAAGWAWSRVVGRSVPSGLRAAVAVTAAVAVGVAVTHPPDRRGWPPPDWFLIMCDVGQGDALLLRSGAGAAVVVDAGPDPDAVDRCLADAGIDTVPAVVLTHFHADHVRGLVGVLRGRAVGEVLSTPIRDPAEEAAAVDLVLADAGKGVLPITAGDERRIGDVSWRAIWPRRRIASGSVPNNASVVLVARIRGHAVLLAGDVEPEAQTAIAADLVGVRWDAVKVPHHGSRNQAEALTVWARAPVALISVGADNDYGHPAPETLAAWEDTGALVARTDRDGDVALTHTAAGVGVVVRRGMLPSP